MDIEKGQSFNVKIQWGKQKFNFDFDVTNDLETIKGMFNFTKLRSTR